MINMKKVIVAGATGYLGKYLLKELKTKGYEVVALVRDAKKLEGLDVDQIMEAEVTRPETMMGKFEGVDYVISTVGITRQKDGLTYMDVDYQANANLLKEALNAGFKKFIYVSVLKGPDLTKLKMVEAKELFVKELMSSGIDYTIIRPNGFFSDMTEVLEMAKKGKVYLFGDGSYQANPIHGADLASFIVDYLDSSRIELEIGGPDLMTQNEIANIAFQAIGKDPKISHIPIWVRNVTLGLIRFFSGQKVYGPVEFFMTVMTMDMPAPGTGHIRLKDYYAQRAAELSS